MFAPFLIAHMASQWVMAESPPVLSLNLGFNDAWYNPATDGQGFFITVFPDLGIVSLAWFTYDTEIPTGDAKANLGDDIRAYPHNILNWHEVVNDQFVMDGSPQRASIAYWFAWTAFFQGADIHQ